MDDSFNRPTRYVDQDLTPASTCSDKPRPKSVPPKIKEMIALLGLRYRPTEQTDLEAHAARIALLASDVADIPEKQLRVAIDRWIASSPYLPKASDLIEIARKALPGSPISKPESERVSALRRSCHEWTRTLYADRPDLAGKSEWRVSDHGQAYIHDMSAEEQLERSRYLAGRGAA